MRYRSLGKTGLMVSEIGFGAEWIGKMDDADVRAIAKGAVEAGVNIVDCWMADPVPESVREHYRALGIAAEACVGCKLCEPRCPFGVPIAEKMENTVRLFGF